MEADGTGTEGRAATKQEAAADCLGRTRQQATGSNERIKTSKAAWGDETLVWRGLGAVFVRMGASVR